MRRFVQAIALSVLLVVPLEVRAQADSNLALKEIARLAHAATGWRSLSCVATRRSVCADTCQPAPPAVHVSVTRDGVRGTVKRCDNRGCDTYEASVHTGGVFTNIQMLAPSGYLIKIQGDQEFVEIATLGLTVHYASGKCQSSQ